MDDPISALANDLLACIEQGGQIGIIGDGVQLVLFLVRKFLIIWIFLNFLYFKKGDGLAKCIGKQCEFSNINICWF